MIVKTIETSTMTITTTIQENEDPGCLENFSGEGSAPKKTTKWLASRLEERLTEARLSKAYDEITKVATDIHNQNREWKKRTDEDCQSYQAARAMNQCEALQRQKELEGASIPACRVDVPTFSGTVRFRGPISLEECLESPKNPQTSSLHQGIKELSRGAANLFADKEHTRGALIDGVYTVINDQGLDRTLSPADISRVATDLIETLPSCGKIIKPKLPHINPAALVPQAVSGNDALTNYRLFKAQEQMQTARALGGIIQAGQEAISSGVGAVCHSHPALQTLCDKTGRAAVAVTAKAIDVTGLRFQAEKIAAAPLRDCSEGRLAKMLERDLSIPPETTCQYEKDLHAVAFGGARDVLQSLVTKAVSP